MGSKIKKTIENVVGVGMGPKTFSLFDFCDLKNDGEKYIKNGQYIYLRNSEIGFWVDFKELQNKQQMVTLKPSKEKTEHAVFKILKVS